MGKIKKRAGRGIIDTAIRDLASSDDIIFGDAKAYVESAQFPVHCEWAAYPPELLDVLTDMMAQSFLQRYRLEKEIRAVLKQEWP